MIVAVQGTSDFDNYSVFLRAMGVVLSGMQKDDSELTIYSAGPSKINAFVSEFSNLSERGLKSRGKKIRFYRVAPSLIEENINYLNYFAFFSNPNQPTSKLYAIAELNGIEVGTFRH